MFLTSLSILCISAIFNMNCTSRMACFLVNLNFATVWKVCLHYSVLNCLNKLPLYGLTFRLHLFIYMYNIRKMRIAVSTRCWPTLRCRWCKWNETDGHDVDQHFDVDDVNKKERVRYRHDVEFMYDVDMMSTRCRSTLRCVDNVNNVNKILERYDVKIDVVNHWYIDNVDDVNRI